MVNNKLHDLKYQLIGLLIFTLFLIPSSAKCGGLNVEPGGILIQNAPVGEIYDILKKSGVVVRIYNRMDRTTTYNISVHKPSETESGQWNNGYNEIPDPSWLVLDRNKVTVAADNVGEVRLYLKIPQDESYYDQQWAMIISIEGQPVPGEIFAVAAYLPVLIETAGRTKIEQKPL